MTNKLLCSNEPKCPKCGSNDVLLRQTEIAYYPITEVMHGQYEIGSSIDKYWDCTDEQFACNGCDEFLEQEELEISSGVREAE